MQFLSAQWTAFFDCLFIKGRGHCAMFGLERAKSLAITAVPMRQPRPSLHLVGLLAKTPEVAKTVRREPI